MQAKDILQLEKELSFQSFNNEDAYTIALSLIKRVQKDKLKNIRIRIVLNHDLVFQYLMDGKKGELWLNRKQKTVETFQHSSYYVFLENEENQTYQCYENDESLAICGGGFPIIVEDKIVGSVIVSGLTHDQDHQLIIDALQTYKNKQPKAFASDIDGTFFFPDLKGSYKQGDLNAIQRFQKAGHLFGVCSGRPLCHLTEIRKLGLDFYIASSGAILLDRDFHVIEDSPLSKKLAQKVFDDYKNQAGIIIQTNSQTTLYATFEEVKNDHLSLIHELDDIQEDFIYSLSLIVENEHVASQISKELNNSYPELEGFQNKNSIDIVMRGCSKGVAMKKMKQWLHVKEMVGIGDSYNDIPLLEEADISFTFHTSPKTVQDQATYIVDTLEEAINMIINKKGCGK